MWRYVGGDGGNVDSGRDGDDLVEVMSGVCGGIDGGDDDDYDRDGGGDSDDDGGCNKGVDLLTDVSDSQVYGREGAGQTRGEKFPGCLSDRVLPVKQNL